MNVKCQHLGAVVTILHLAVQALIDLDNEHCQLWGCICYRGQKDLIQ